MNDLSTPKPSAKKRLLITLLKLFFSVIVLALLLIYKTSVRDVLRVFGSVRIPWLIFAFSLHAVGLFASAYRWQILASAQGDEIPLGFLMKSYLVGTFFSNFLPGSFGGDIVRIWDGSRYSRSIVKSSAIVAVERLTGLIVLFLFALLASLFRLKMARDVPVIGVSLAMGVIGLALLTFFLLPVSAQILSRLPGGKTVQTAVRKILLFRETVLHYRHKKGPFLFASLWALLLQANVIVYFFFIGKAFNLEIRFLDYFIFVPIVLLIQIIPVTINGLGLREGSYIEIFKYYGILPQTAFSFSLIDVGFRMIMGALGGIIYALRK